MLTLHALGGSTHASAVLGMGAWLKSTACLLDGDKVLMSDVHGDLSDPAACEALEASVEALSARARGCLTAIAHDLHPDFFSTQLAVNLADRLGVPAIGVQHHHAHIAAVMAEHGLRQPVLGLALDGVGLGSDGTAWGGELLQVDGAQMSRLGHLWPLALPGGDAAASQPWRMAASVLHAMGRGAELEARFGPVVGVPTARMLRGMLDQSINCPHTSSMGRWFDAAAGALGLSVRQRMEAEAAMALEQVATDWLSDGRWVHDLADKVADELSVLDLRPLMTPLLDGSTSTGEGAAQFHVSLASVLARWVAHASQQTGLRTVCLSGGCFANAVLRTRLCADLAQRGIQVYTAQTFACGDAGIALGQAWVVSRQREANANVNVNVNVNVYANVNATANGKADVNFSAQTPTAASVHHDQPEATTCA